MVQFLLSVFLCNIVHVYYALSTAEYFYGFMLLYKQHFDLITEITNLFEQNM